jgi:hypothetical protein
LLFVLLHTPPVRRAIGAALLSWVGRKAGVTATFDRLDYQLWRGRATLAGLDVHGHGLDVTAIAIDARVGRHGLDVQVRGPRVRLSRLAPSPSGEPRDPPPTPRIPRFIREAAVTDGTVEIQGRDARWHPLLTGVQGEVSRQQTGHRLGLSGRAPGLELSADGTLSESGFAGKTTADIRSLADAARALRAAGVPHVPPITAGALRLHVSAEMNAWSLRALRGTTTLEGTAESAGQTLAVHASARVRDGTLHIESCDVRTAASRAAALSLTGSVPLTTTGALRLAVEADADVRSLADVARALAPLSAAGIPSDTAGSLHLRASVEANAWSLHTLRGSATLDGTLEGAAQTLAISERQRATALPSP